jgi:uncharacterized protein YwqG
MKPTIRITTSKDKISKSFFGGSPKLSPDFEWPIWDATPLYLDEIKYAEKTGRECGTENYWNGEIEKIKIKLQEPLIPLVFLGQIYLDEIPRYGGFPDLPTTGTLCFFWDELNDPAGWRASSKGSCRVIYSEDISNPVTIPFPEDKAAKIKEEAIMSFPKEMEELNEMFNAAIRMSLADDQTAKFREDSWNSFLEETTENYKDKVGNVGYSPCYLSFEAGWISSRYLDAMLERYDDEDDDDIEDVMPSSFLEEHLEEIPHNFPVRDESSIVTECSGGEAIHLLFGSPMVIQNPMEEECQLSFHGFDATDYDLGSDPEVAFLKDGVEDWQLLLQLDSDDNLDWMWGDLGRLYFWIRKQDLEKHDFSNVWCEKQCS